MPLTVSWNRVIADVIRALLGNPSPRQRQHHRGGLQNWHLVGGLALSIAQTVQARWQPYQHGLSWPSHLPAFRKSPLSRHDEKAFGNPADSRPFRGDLLPSIDAGDDESSASDSDTYERNLDVGRPMSTWLLWMGFPASNLVASPARRPTINMFGSDSCL